MGSYPYKPLKLPDETRVLTIAQGRTNDPVICSLSHVTIGSDTGYEALSYCWGSSARQQSGVAAVDFENTEVTVATYGQGDDGATVAHSMQAKMRDLVDHPYYHQFYVRFGGVLPPGEIVCDGHHVAVGGELLSALRALRHEYAPLVIWVDALCINQSDVSERNEHVRIMGSIYANADLVRVWLGPETGVEAYVERVLEDANEIFTDVYQQLPESDTGIAPFEGQSILTSHPKWKGVEWDRLGDIIGRAWFERSWVLQEIVNAKDAIVHVGLWAIPWEYLSGTCHMLRRYRLDFLLAQPAGAKAMYMMGSLRTRRQNASSESMRLPILMLLEELREFKSTIASDKIYSIMALTDYNVDVNYAKSSEEVFTDLAVEKLLAGSIHILCHCVESDRPTALDLPSWVPDWTRPGWVEPFYIRGLRYFAAGNTKPQLRLEQPDRKVLRVKGRMLDRLADIDDKKLIPPPNVADPTRELGVNVMDGAARASQRSKCSLQDEKDSALRSVEVAFPDRTCSDEQFEGVWRTYMCNRTRDNEVPDSRCGQGWERLAVVRGMERIPVDRVPQQPDSAPLDTEYSAGLEDEETPVSNGQRASGDFRTEDFRTFYGAYAKWCYNRRFYRTEGGRYGWAVDGAQVGDVVGLFYGADYPFVLREVGQGQYRIVGDTYIHGLMDGEGLETSFGEEEFVIV